MAPRRCAGTWPTSFLKILEEPPESATLILLAPSPYALLPTIVSRCFQFYFAPLAAAQIEVALERQTQLTPKARQLAAQMSEGSLGLALAMDVDRNLEVRREALRLLELAAGGKSSLLFAQTGALTKKQDVPFETVLEMLSSLLNDLLELTTSPADAVLRNLALQKELRALSEKVTPNGSAERSQAWTCSTRACAKYQPPAQSGRAGRFARRKMMNPRIAVTHFQGHASH